MGVGSALDARELEGGTAPTGAGGAAREELKFTARLCNDLFSAPYDAIPMSNAAPPSPANPQAAPPDADRGTGQLPAASASQQSAIASTRWLAVGSLLALMLLCLAWELWLAPLRPGGSWLALKALPLAVPLAGLLKRRMYTYRWLSLMIWLYFTEAVVRAWSDPAPSRWLACAELALCLLLFVACAAHVRLRQRAAKSQQAAL